MKLKELRPLAKPSRRKHLRQCYVKAKDLKNRKKMVGIKKKMEQEEKRGSWWRVNKVTDEPKLGAISRVEREERGRIVEI